MSSKFTKKNYTYRWYDDTQSCKISCPNSTSFWLEICYFYISQTKSSFDKVFYKIVYYHIIYMCDFFGDFRQLFYRGLYGFSQSCGLHQICSHYIKRKTKLTKTTTHWDVNHWETKGAHAFHRPHAPLGNGNKLNVVQRFIACRDPRLFVDEPLKKDTMFFTWG